MTQAVALAQQASTGVSQGFKNRIINGAMVIDQRNAGASVTPTVSGVFPVDRWSFNISQSSKFSAQQDAGAVTPPVGFTDYLGVTSLSSYTLVSNDYFNLLQTIEGFNCADLGWGTANAKTVTLSFWVRSSLTGTFGGVIQNYSGSRFYPFSYTINSANTWEFETITIAGDTTGTWSTNNTGSIQIRFGLGVGSIYSGPAGSWSGTTYASTTGAVSVVGTNGATFYITGVQLEVGSTATNFETRSYTTELQLCQRYYYRHITGTSQNIGAGGFYTTNYLTWTCTYPVTMRTPPSLVQSSGSGYYTVYANGTGNSFSSFNAGIQQSTVNCVGVDANSSSGVIGTNGYAGRIVATNASSSIAFDAEL